MSTEKQLTVPKFVESKLPDIRNSLPGTVAIADREQQAERLRVAFCQAFNAKPDLRNCTHMSIAAALMNCASLGIIPETPEKHAYLIPRKKKVGDQYELHCELEVSYRGFVHLIIRGDRARRVLSDVVHDGDEYEFQNGDPIICRHVPNLKDPDRRNKPVIAAWALVIFPDGGKKLEVMDRDDLKKIEGAMMRQNFDKASPSWKMWKTEMQRKAPIKRLAKTADLGPEVAKAAEIDNEHFTSMRTVESTPIVLPSGETIPALEEKEHTW